MSSLISKRGIDYTKLADLLSDKEWKEADEETCNVMCQVMRRSKFTKLSIQDISQFPCEDLRRVDELWTKYSTGHFGFSVQKRIFNEEGNDAERFASRIGWIANNLWIAFSDVTWNDSAPEGHLPIGGRGGLFAGIGDIGQGKGLAGLLDSSFQLGLSTVGDLIHPGGLDRFWRRLNHDTRLKNGFSKLWMRPRLTLLARLEECADK